MKSLLKEKIQFILKDLQETGMLPVFDMPEIRIERPREERFGEYTTNIALVLSASVKKSPIWIAELIVQRLTESSQKEEFFEKIEMVQPGYINFYLSGLILTDICKTAIGQGGSFGNSEIGKEEKVNNEFISANPTGPLHIGNGRGGIFGDTLSRILRKTGYDVTNEYYVNDAGEQTLKLAHSVLGDSEAVYAGEYIDELKKRSWDNLSLEAIATQASAVVLNEYIRPTVKDLMRIAFDQWTSEKQLIKDGYIDKALGILKEKGFVYESEGALWLRTTDYGDDKDRVLVKGNGVRTYFASDCGYILFKMERGFSRLILTLGADHHGYKARLLAAAQALGFTGKFDFVFVQLVKLMKDGEEVRMSKRAGNVVTINELVELVGTDVVRFFFLMYASDTHMNFDLGLAEEQSQKNPVFYVQYAYARASSLLRRAEAEGLVGEDVDFTLLIHPKERELMRELLLFPELVEEIAADYAVHKLPQYAIRLSDKLHSFYDVCRVLDSENKPLSGARIELIKAVRGVLAETLRLMGITAPEKM